MCCRTLRCLLFAMLALMFTATALAQRSDGQASNSREAATIAVQKQPGKVLSVKRENGQFKVKILHEGKVSYVIVKAR